MKHLLWWAFAIISAVSFVSIFFCFWWFRIRKSEGPTSVFVLIGDFGLSLAEVSILLCVISTLVTWLIGRNL